MGRFEKGMPRPPGSGRKKGSKNKKKLPSLEDICADQNFNPAKVAMACVAELFKKQEYLAAGKLSLELTQYLYPKAKPFEDEDDEQGSDAKAAVSELSHEERIRLIRNASASTATGTTSAE